MEQKPPQLQIIRINSQKNISFYLKKCLEAFEKNSAVEMTAIGQAAGMLIKVCEGMQRIHGCKMKKLESVGFYERKQYKKRKLQLIARIEKKEILEKKE